MKLSTFLLLIAILQVTAHGYSQDTKISLSIQKGHLTDVFKAIEKQSDFKIFYKVDQVDLKKQIDFSAQNISINKLLSEILPSTGATFDVIDKVIVITQATDKDGAIQQQKISGSITDASTGDPLIGVNVTVEGTTIGVISDINGSFSIDVTQANAVLVFSYIGYTTEKVAYSGQTTLQIKLISDVTKLDEIVVVGYGTKKKKDIIGSVSSISSQDINQLSVASIDAGLQGKGAGLQVMSSGGTPGAPARVLVRGTNTISLDTDPLYIVDGMPISTQTLGISEIGSVNLSPLSTINPNDIENIQVLKDAAATSIYGSRASNGVILITTKSGKSGKGNVEFSFNTGVSDLSRKADDIGFCTSNQYFTIMDEARKNSGLTPMTPKTLTNTWNYKNPGDTLTKDQAKNIDNNWFDQILRKGRYQELNFSTSKGGEKSSIFVSFNYRNDEGVLKNNNLQRISGRINADFSPVNNLTAGFRVNLAYSKNNRMKDQTAYNTGGSNGNGGGFSAVNTTVMPWFPINSALDPTGYWNAQAGFNPAATIDPALVRDEQQTYRGLGGAYLQYSLPWIKGLSFRTEFSADITQSNSWNSISKYLRSDLKSYAQERSQLVNNCNYNFYGTYNRTMGFNDITLTMGTESQSYFIYNKSMEAKDVLGSYQQIGVNPLTVMGITSNITNERYIRSYFGRADYKFKDRYFLGFSLRSDASSVFPTESQWATFKAFSAGWVVSDEKFWSLKAVNLLKIRGSYGQTGNQNIPANVYMTRWGDINRYGNADVTPNGSALSGIRTPLRWELTNNYDAGIDFGILQNRVSGSVAYFVHDIKDLLMLTSIPISSGIDGGKMWQNIGKMRNSGLELEINAVPLTVGDFKWTTSFNVTFNTNKVLALNDLLDRTNKGLQTSETLTKKNGKIGAYFMAEYAGVDPQHGVETIYEIDAKIYAETGQTVKTGNIIAATTENMSKNKIIHEDKTGLATYWGGFTNTFSYKGFDLNMFFTFQGGNYLFDYGEKIATTPQRGQFNLRSDLVGNTWTKPGDNAAYPQLVWDQTFGWDMSKATNYQWVAKSTGYNNESNFHDKYLHKGDFVRLKNMQIGYTLPASFLTKIKVQGFRIFVSGTNLLTFTKFKGYDPEVVSLGNNLSPGVVSYQVPNLKTYSFGVNIKF